MIAYAEAELPLWRVEPSSKVGLTKKAMLTQVWKTTGRKPKELEAVPDFPSSLLYVWQWFLELSVPGETLTYTEIEAYNRLLSKGMTPGEVVLLKRLDSLR